KINFVIFYNDLCIPLNSNLSIRRTAASNIYNCGAGIKLTADILGHESLDSTTHYVRVDFTALREICHEWPGKGAAK
ncbi:MAG: tyrosine-type recombinase/integrase, partial [Ruminococcus callidus]